LTPEAALMMNKRRCEPIVANLCVLIDFFSSVGQTFAASVPSVMGNHHFSDYLSAFNHN